MSNSVVDKRRKFILDNFGKYITNYKDRKVINIFSNTLLETQMLFNCLNSVGLKWSTGEDLNNFNKLDSIYYSFTKFNKRFIFITYIDIQDLKFFTDNCISCTVYPYEQFYNLKAISYSSFVNIININKACIIKDDGQVE